MDARTPAHIAPIAQDPRQPALALRGLAKAFEGSPAVHNLSLDIPRGSFYGLVGPNGAGKTTTIMMATGLLRPDAGTAVVCGHDIWAAGTGQHPEPDGAEVLAAKAAYGLLADGLPVFDRLSGREYLEYLGLLRGMDASVVDKRSKDLLGALDLAEAQDKYIVDYSAGMTKKILLAGALLHRPEILILDEPFEAVDPVSGQVIRQILHNYVAAGGTVVMSSHVMELVQGICDHVAVIARGQVLASGQIDEVRGQQSLSDLFVQLVGGRSLDADSLGWLGEARR
ncbi:ABC transporter ATP-binding protein [Corynebacterium heidelbergense]|uniref:ABC transporter ATP-binding protein n=1 Tax=Corynebacterium heidelbergense TaxID=2055947 RepID=A0A364VBL7_9CORY|nr:ABC transporter ATP-binding protein [Corynebacterium heidelbergense]RAV34045.1 ABC transporter ATP-binding protein [Corynebacterium heidelbergense]WCZ35629.1 Daunorubicin/doxorubicin resistance ATP-binding protein DrrA [Corynebacterium heidelbergense]